MTMTSQSLGPRRLDETRRSLAFRHSIQAGNNSTLALDLQFARDQAFVSRRGPTPTFTRASTGTFVGSNGLIQTASNNVPRIEFDPVTRQCLGLLIEEARQNLTINSEDLTQTSWSNTNVTVTANQTVAPDGSSTADLVAETAVSNQHFTYANLASVTLGTTYTASIFLKKGTGATAPDWVMLSNILSGFGARAIAFNVSTGAFGNAVGGLTGTAKQYPNGWWRVSLTSTATATGSYGAMPISFTNNTNTTSAPSYLGKTTSDLFVWGAQFEEGSFASSYIPTTTTSLVRSADVCSITGAAFTGFYNQTEGAMVFKGDRVLGNNSAGLSGFPRYISFDDGTVSNRIHLWWVGGPNAYNVTVGGVDVVSITTTAITDGSRFGLSARYTTNDFAVSQNGGAPSTDVSGSVPTVDRLGIGMAGALGRIINGHIHTVQYFNAIKTNAQLQALSTP